MPEERPYYWSSSVFVRSPPVDCIWVYYAGKTPTVDLLLALTLFSYRFCTDMAMTNRFCKSKLFTLSGVV